MDNSANGKDKAKGALPKPRRVPPVARRSSNGRKIGRPAYPFYGIYSTRRTPTWALKPRPGKKNNSGKVLFIIFGSLLAFMVISVAALIFMMVSFGTGAVVSAYNYYSRGLSLERKYAVSFETTRIFDRNGILLYEKQPDAGAREFVPLKEIPQVLIDATLAAEDPTFFENQGVEVYAIFRAVAINLSGSGFSGFSTITQQLARLVYLPPGERTQQSIDRKIREMILATWITDKYTKQQILEEYLNSIYYGNLAYGIEAAAQGYFGKHAKDLNLAEASMLAGLPQAPSAYDPTVNYEYARQRQSKVLELMVKYEKITDAEAREAFTYDIKAHLQDRRKKPVNIRAPHFVNWLLQEVSSESGLKQLTEAGILINPEDWSQGGYDVYTTIDVRLVDEAEAIARKRVEDLKKQNATNAALVSIRPSTGEIMSMIGSVDFNRPGDGQFNSAVAYRQPGSSIKPITYAAAMTKGWTAATVIADVPTTFSGGGGQGYTPANFNGSFAGPIPLRTALGSSLNIPAVKALQYDGIQYMMDLAAEMGIKFQKTADFYGLPLTLGGGEVRLLDLVSAYTVFANAGVKVEPVAILKINRRGKTLYEFDPNAPRGKQVLTPQIAYEMTDILSDNKARLIAFAANNPLVLSRPAAAKTGTTNDFKDSWTVGYTPDLATGVWIGNNDNTPMLAVAGSIGGGYVFHDYMEKVYGDPELSKAIQPNGKPLLRDFVQPPGMVRVTICVESGLLPNDKPEFDCPEKRLEIFPATDVPKVKSTLHQRVKVPKRLGPDGKPVVADGAKTVIRNPSDENSGDITINDPTYCLAGDSYPPDLLEERLFFNYPRELRDWGIRRNRLPPPTEPCPPYVAPTPTPEASPSVSPGADQSITPIPISTPINGDPNPTPVNMTRVPTVTPSRLVTPAPGPTIQAPPATTKP